MKIIIVTRHPPAVEWLRRRGITGEAIAHIDDPGQIRGCHVIGNLPPHLAAEAAKLSMIELPSRTGVQRGHELSVEEMEAAGTALATYRVIRL